MNEYGLLGCNIKVSSKIRGVAFLNSSFRWVDWEGGIWMSAKSVVAFSANKQLRDLRELPKRMIALDISSQYCFICRILSKSPLSVYFYLLLV